jgi:hypothetical protein
VSAICGDCVERLASPAAMMAAALDAWRGMFPDLRPVTIHPAGRA